VSGNVQQTHFSEADVTFVNLSYKDCKIISQKGKKRARVRKIDAAGADTELLCRTKDGEELPFVTAFDSKCDFVNLPEAKKGVYYIVLSSFAGRMPKDRNDFIFPCHYAKNEVQVGDWTFSVTR
jgi:hypothetical protein